MTVMMEDDKTPRTINNATGISKTRSHITASCIDFLSLYLPIFVFIEILNFSWKYCWSRKNYYSTPQAEAILFCLELISVAQDRQVEATVE